MNNPIHIISVSASHKSDLAELLADYQLELIPYSGQSVAEVQSYKYLPSYFSDPERAAYFIMAGDEVAGFALVNTHTLIEPQAHSIAEFYIKPAFRKQRIGEEAAVLVFAQFPGKWEVAQMASNLPAINFWHKVVTHVTHGQFKATVLTNDKWHGPVLIFVYD